MKNWYTTCVLAAAFLLGAMGTAMVPGCSKPPAPADNEPLIPSNTTDAADPASNATTPADPAPAEEMSVEKAGENAVEIVEEAAEVVEEAAEAVEEAAEEAVEATGEAIEEATE